MSYQMMGSVMDAEDIVQDVFLSLEEGDGTQIRNAKSYLCKMTVNRCLNKLKSASRQRETYVGPWLPEPYAAVSDDPMDQYIIKESLTTAYLLLLHQLSDMERIVFLLREVFTLPFSEIAMIVDKSEGNCRQIDYRARRSLAQQPETRSEVRAVGVRHVETFIQALATGNMNLLLDILKVDATLYTDGGGKAQAALRPIVGSKIVARYFEAIRPKVPQDFVCELREVNALPGIVIKTGPFTFSVISIQIENDLISNVYIVMNPEKLLHFNL
ncbi:RNA polymerase sigma factor SigJ [Paenibacillus sp. FSL R5-808]|nr:RNA polymerase subunit sigma [Paenibacillus glucanolyticus]ETT39882.1 RNA polymerase sigma factor SigJ [Paenibacillus sp. FSL R5-808]